MKKALLALAVVLLSCTAKEAPLTSPPLANSTPTPVLTVPASAAPTARLTPSPSPTPPAFYTLVEGDWDWGRLVDKMGVVGEDPIGEILRWNPEVRNPYGLLAGQKLRIPGRSLLPKFPGYNEDRNRWQVLATHTSKFAGSSENRIANIVNGANYLNNWFDDAAHPAVMPRAKFGLNEVFGETTLAKGYRPGFAIIVVNGKQEEVASDGGGICQVPSTVFPALLKAGLNVLERQNHTYYPYWWWSYPEGFGWDATINTPDDPNLVFRNMYDYPVRLFAKVDRDAKTLRIDVLGPPELKVYPVTVVGPFFGTVDHPGQLTAGSNWVTGVTVTTVIQKVDVGGSTWTRSFQSDYAAAPH